MLKIMVLGAASPVSELVIEDLEMNADIDYVFYNSDVVTPNELQMALKDVNVIYCNLPAEDIDQNILTVFEVLRSQQQVLDRFILLTEVGVNGELNDQAQLTAEQREIRWQQQYAIKIIDEEEINYTVIRQSPLTNPGSDKLTIYQEGTPMPQGTVSVTNVAKISLEALFTEKFVNQSIGLIDRLTTEEAK
ncbi:NAD(P)H-binding protein [Lentilactobacillus senioris]|uniref:NAD(P)H-binding protein n=1 Tax=Lentilactobacillus senioris TaxID=931534 RepID=UPI00227E64C3|nr:NAD(P)H-binding protein [Lentilactobacillus senioris]MCY9805939.1 NAD(P)H-binding protein [Lentilactobacillus senioris]